MKKLLGGLAISALLAAPALAADLPARVPVKAPAPVVVAAYNWSGCYIGVAGGWAWGRSTHDLTGGAVDTGPFNVNGGIVGGTLGCNFQSNQFVFGIEGDGSWVGKNGEAPNPATPNFISRTEENWLATIRGRLGLAFDRSLIYATGGIAFAGVEATATNTTTGVAISESQTRTGWTAGGGWEYAFAGNWSAKAEYLYVQFSKDAYLQNPPAGFTARDDVKLHNHIFRVGLNYRFGGGPVVARY